MRLRALYSLENIIRTLGCSVSVFLWIGLLSFSAAETLKSAPCDFLERKASYRGLYRFSKLFQQKEGMLAASFYGIKELNETFGDNGVGAEHLVSVLHYLIQKNLYEAIPASQKNSFQVVEASSPYLKFFTIKFKLKNFDLQNLETLLLAAQTRSVEQLVEYVFSENQEISQIVMSSPALTSNGFKIVVPGMESKLPQVSILKLKEIQSTLGEKFGKKLRVQEFFMKKLGLGIGHSELDALLMSRLKTNYAEMFKGFFEFNLSYFLFALHRVEATQRNLDWFFDENKVLNIKDVVLVRKHYFKSIHEGFSKEYLELLDRQSQTTDNNDLNFQRILRHQQLKDFFDVLSLTDYLPSSKLTLDQSAREGFDRLKSPNIIGFMDIKGLGAKNYVRVYEEIPNLKKQMSNVLNIIRSIQGQEKSTGQKVNLSEDPNFQGKFEELSKALESLISTREKILDTSDQFVQQIRSALKNSIESFGVKAEDYVIWASGDDVVFSIRTNRGSSVQLLNNILSNRILLENTRAAALDVSQNNVSLSHARVLLGPIAVISKHMEELGFEDFYIHSDTTKSTDLKLKFIQEDGRYRSAESSMIEGLNQNIFDRASSDYRFVR